MTEATALLLVLDNAAATVILSDHPTTGPLLFWGCLLSGVLPFGLAPHDAHVHCWPRPAGGGRRPDVSGLLRAMDAAGVDRAAVVTPEGVDNESTLAACRAHRDRLAPIARVAEPGHGAAETVRAVADAGASGLRVVAMEEPDRLTRRELHQFWAATDGTDLPVTVHLLASGAAAVDVLAARWPGLTFLVDHLGRPDVAAGVEAPAFRALLELARHDNVSVKTPNSAYFARTTPPYPDLAPFVATALAAYGDRRLVWGSDWPACTATDDYQSAAEPTATVLASVPHEAWHAVLRGNFERLFDRGNR